MSQLCYLPWDSFLLSAFSLFLLFRNLCFFIFFFLFLITESSCITILVPFNGSLTVSVILVAVAVIITAFSMPSCMGGMPVFVAVCKVLLKQDPQIGFLITVLVIPNHPGRNALPSMFISFWCPVCSSWLELKYLSLLILYLAFHLSVQYGERLFLSCTTKKRLEENNPKESDKRQ